MKNIKKSIKIGELVYENGDKAGEKASWFREMVITPDNKQEWIDKLSNNKDNKDKGKEGYIFCEPFIFNKAMMDEIKQKKADLESVESEPLIYKAINAMKNNVDGVDEKYHRILKRNNEKVYSFWIDLDFKSVDEFKSVIKWLSKRGYDYNIEANKYIKMVVGDKMLKELGDNEGYIKLMNKVSSKVMDEFIKEGLFELIVISPNNGIRCNIAIDYNIDSIFVDNLNRPNINESCLLVKESIFNKMKEKNMRTNENLKYLDDFNLFKKDNNEINVLRDFMYNRVVEDVKKVLEKIDVGVGDIENGILNIDGGGNNGISKKFYAGKKAVIDFDTKRLLIDIKWSDYIHSDKYKKVDNLKYKKIINQKEFELDDLENLIDIDINDLSDGDEFSDDENQRLYNSFIKSGFLNKKRTYDSAVEGDDEKSSLYWVSIYLLIMNKDKRKNKLGEWLLNIINKNGLYCGGGTIDTSSVCGYKNSIEKNCKSLLGESYNDAVIYYINKIICSLFDVELESNDDNGLYYKKLLKINYKEIDNLLDKNKDIISKINNDGFDVSDIKSREFVYEYNALKEGLKEFDDDLIIPIVIRLNKVFDTIRKELVYSVRVNRDILSKYIDFDYIKKHKNRKIRKGGKKVYVDFKNNECYEYIKVDDFINNDAKVVKLLDEKIDTMKKMIILKAPTGVGKTTYMISKIIKDIKSDDCNSKRKRFIIASPNNNLSKQNDKTFRNAWSEAMIDKDIKIKSAFNGEVCDNPLMFDVIICNFNNVDNIVKTMNIDKDNDVLVFVDEGHILLEYYNAGFENSYKYINLMKNVKTILISATPEDLLNVFNIINKVMPYEVCFEYIIIDKDVIKKDMNIVVKPMNNRLIEKDIIERIDKDKKVFIYFNNNKSINNVKKELESYKSNDKNVKINNYIKRFDNIFINDGVVKYIDKDIMIKFEDVINRLKNIIIDIAKSYNKNGNDNGFIKIVHKIVKLDFDDKGNVIDIFSNDNDVFLSLIKRVLSKRIFKIKYSDIDNEYKWLEIKNKHKKELNNINAVIAMIGVEDLYDAYNKCYDNDKGFKSEVDIYNGKKVYKDNEILVINSNNKDLDENKRLINDENIYKDIKIVLSTKMSEVGLNFNNVEEFDFIYYENIINIDVKSLYQVVGRFRKKNIKLNIKYIISTDCSNNVCNGNFYDKLCDYVGNIIGDDTMSLDNIRNKDEFINGGDLDIVSIINQCYNNLNSKIYTSIRERVDLFEVYFNLGPTLYEWSSEYSDKINIEKDNNIKAFMLNNVEDIEKSDGLVEDGLELLKRFYNKDVVKAMMGNINEYNEYSIINETIDLLKIYYDNVEGWLKCGRFDEIFNIEGFDKYIKEECKGIINDNILIRKKVIKAMVEGVGFMFKYNSNGKVVEKVVFNRSYEYITDTNKVEKCKEWIEVVIFGLVKMKELINKDKSRDKKNVVEYKASCSKVYSTIGGWGKGKGKDYMDDIIKYNADMIFHKSINIFNKKSLNIKGVSNIERFYSIFDFVKKVINDKYNDIFIGNEAINNEGYDIGDLLGLVDDVKMIYKVMDHSRKRWFKEGKGRINRLYFDFKRKANELESKNSYGKDINDDVISLYSLVENKINIKDIIVEFFNRFDWEMNISVKDCDNVIKLSKKNRYNANDISLDKELFLENLYSANKRIIVERVEKDNIINIDVVEESKVINELIKYIDDKGLSGKLVFEGLSTKKKVIKNALFLSGYKTFDKNGKIFISKIYK